MPPVHDYVIDNSTGANVRQDINNALAAIVSNNSSSSEPSTKYAYMWWADTTTGILKIRNSANDGWVELLQLDGTLTLEDGSVSTPGLAFRDDLNTGIFSSAADTFNVATGGVERMELGATTIFNEDGADVDFRIEGDTEANLFYVDAGNDRIGIGTSSPTGTVHIASSNEYCLKINKSDSTAAYIQFYNSTTGSSTSDGFRLGIDSNEDALISLRESGSMKFATTNEERMRIDSSGRFLLNLSTSVTGGKFQVNNTFNTFFTASNDAQGCVLQLEKTRSTSPGSYTIVQDGDVLGELQFKGSTGSGSVIGARIFAKVNGTPGSGNDLPTDLIFRMMPDGSGSTQEAMRIRSDRTVEIATEGAIAGFSSSHVTGSGAPLKIYKSSTTTHAGLQLIWDHFNTTAGISQKIQFTIGDDASSDGFNNAGYIAIEKADSWQSGSGRSSAMAFATTSAATESEKMRILSNGKVLIGTSSNTSGMGILQIQEANSDAVTINGRATNGSYASTVIHAQCDRNTSNASYSFFAGVIPGVQTRFIVRDSGNVTNINGSYGSISDSRLKENIEDASSQWNDIKDLKFRKFNFTEASGSPTHKQLGLVAQEAETVCPNLIEDQNIEIKGVKGNYKTIKTSVLFMKGMKALQEAMAKIEVLETKVAALEAS